MYGYVFSWVTIMSEQHVYLHIYVYMYIYIYICFQRGDNNELITPSYLSSSSSSSFFSSLVPPPLSKVRLSRSPEQITSICRTWDNYVHPRAKEFWSDERQLNDVLRTSDVHKPGLDIQYHTI